MILKRFINKNLIDDTRKIGFVSSFSKINESRNDNIFRANVITALIDASSANNFFHTDRVSRNNRLYNRMRFLGFNSINLININKDNSFINDNRNNERFFTITIPYNRPDSWVESSFDKTNFNLHVNVYNLTFEEFSDLDTIQLFINEDSNNSIFFFETLKWSEVVDLFFKNGITINGGSSNQRHIFNNLQYSFSLLLTTLFGKTFSYDLTDFMKFKKSCKDLYNPKFNNNSLELKMINSFIKIVNGEGYYLSFMKISISFLKLNYNLYKINSLDIFKLWMRFFKITKNENVVNVFCDICDLILQSKSEEEICKIFSNYDIISEKEITWFNQFNTNIFNSLYNKDSISTHNFFIKRFYSYDNSLKEKYINVYQKLDLSNINSRANFKVQKREYHTSLIRNNKTELKPLELNQIKLNKYLTSLEGIVNDNSIDNRNKQIKLENSFFNFHEEIIEKNKDSSKIDVKSKILLKYKERLDIIISNNTLKRKFGNLSLLLNNIKWIFITSSILSISNNKGYNNTANIIGEYILFYIWLDFKNIIENNKSKISIISHKSDKKSIIRIKNKKAYDFIDFFDLENLNKWYEITFNDWKQELEIDFNFILNLGDLFISLFTDELTNESPIFIRKSNNYSYKDPYIIAFNPDIDESLINNFLQIPSNNLPMLEKPDLWSENQIGGFLTTHFKKKSLITNPKVGSNSHETSNLSKAYKVINQLNSIEFEINNLLLEYLLNEGSWILEYIKSISNNDEWIYNKLTINLAKTFSKSKKFHFNHYLDWRGRIYNSSTFLNYQGNDIGSALLLFKNGDKLNENGKYYLFIALANNHNENNISKLSFWERYNWVIFNYHKIINLDKDLIMKAEKPLNFISLALTLREIDKNNNYLVKNPIFLDATCSGIQHVSALLRDFELATLTNLNKSSKVDIPEDFYSDVINKVNIEINEFGAKNKEYFNLMNVKLDRNLAKESIMTVVYNVSVFGMKEQLARKLKKIIKENKTIERIDESYTNSLYNELADKSKRKSKILIYEFPSKNDNIKVHISPKELFMISRILNNFIFSEYKGLGKVYLFISEMTKITNLLNLPVIWKAPNGIEFSQHYHKNEKGHSKIRLFGVVKELHYKKYINEMDKNKQKNAIIPNVIHTLDASHLYEIILEGIKKNINVISIHDCFGTHPNNMGNIHHIVRKTFILQYSDHDFLNNFRNKIVDMIKLYDYEVIEENNSTKLIYQNKEYIIPETPKLGEFDLKLIEGSNYIIS